MTHSILTFVILFAAAFLGCILADITYDRWLAKPINALLDRLLKRDATALTVALTTPRGMGELNPTPTWNDRTPTGPGHRKTVPIDDWRDRARKTQDFGGGNGSAA